jgi:hypothetical protein
LAVDAFVGFSPFSFSHSCCFALMASDLA